MEPTELRIGNLVKGNHLYEGKELIIKGISYDDHRILYFDGTVAGEYIYDCSGVQLTEEWLHKFGFSEENYHVGFIGIDHKAGGMTTDFVLTEPNVLGEFQKCYAWEFKTGRLPKFIELQFVHELQNLFFTLTGEELTIK
jgi:hypothetical protein